jgi:hypothetical protein
MKVKSLVNYWGATCSTEEHQSVVSTVLSEREIALEGIKTQIDDWATHGKQTAESARMEQEEPRGRGIFVKRVWRD